MEVTIGKRNAFICNLKVFLMFFVVYGHLIETKMDDNEVFMWQYYIIYAIHMPMFAFLSGMFLKGKNVCLLQCKKILLYYCIFQCFSMIVWYVLKQEKLSFSIPYWHLWYLLSLSCWAFLCFLLEYVEAYFYGTIWKVFLIIVCIGVACIIGNVESVNRIFSLSRTIVFFPYVLMGKYFPINIDLKKYKIASILIGNISFALLIYLKPMIPVQFFYHADSYQTIGVEHGTMIRFLSYLIAVGLGFFAFVWIPKKRLWISKIGTDTFWIYLFHAPMVLVLREVVFWENEFLYIASWIAVVIILFLYKGFQWGEKLYRIV